MKVLIWTALLLFSPAVWGLSVTSLNIQWYGIGGVLEGESGDEYRDDRIHEFLTEQIPTSDVYVFQEVTDMVRVASLLIGYQCYTYSSQNIKHQHVVICADPAVVISSTVEYSVQLNSPGLRPAMVLNVKYKDKEVAIVGLHLKAKRDSTDKRLSQVQALADSQLISDNAILIGDFNSYDKASTGRSSDDSELFDGLLGPVNYVQSINETNSPTFLGFSKRILDRVWTRGMEVQSHKVYGPCNRESVSGPFNNNGFFKRFVSDHCAIQVTF